LCPYSKNVQLDGVRVMVFNATFNNISAILWRSVLVVAGKRSTRRKPPTWCSSHSCCFVKEYNLVQNYQGYFCVRVLLLFYFLCFVSNCFQICLWFQLHNWKHMAWYICLIQYIYKCILYLSVNKILWRSVLVVAGKRSTRRKPPTWCNSMTNFITYYCIEYISPWAGFEPTILVVYKVLDIYIYWNMFYKFWRHINIYPLKFK
jgi:hypothetical protein